MINFSCPCLLYFWFVASFQILSGLIQGDKSWSYFFESTKFAGHSCRATIMILIWLKVIAWWVAHDFACCTSISDIFLRPRFSQSWSNEIIFISLVWNFAGDSAHGLMICYDSGQQTWTKAICMITSSCFAFFFLLILTDRWMLVSAKLLQARLNLLAMLFRTKFLLVNLFSSRTSLSFIWNWLNNCSAINFFSCF